MAAVKRADVRNTQRDSEVVNNVFKIKEANCLLFSFEFFGDKFSKYLRSSCVKNLIPIF